MFRKIFEEQIPGMAFFDVYHGHQIVKEDFASQGRLSVDGTVVADGTRSMFRVIGGALTYNDLAKNLTYYNFETHEKRLYGKYYILNGRLYEKNRLIYKDAGDAGVYYGDCTEGERLYRFPVDSITALFESDDVFVVVSDSTIFGLDRVSGIKRWNFSEKDRYSAIFSDPGILTKTILKLGVWKNMFITLLPTRELLAIDVSDGHEVWRSSELQTISDEYFVLAHPHLDAKKGVICFLEGAHYCVFDLTSLTITAEKNFHAGATPLSWNFNRPTFTESHVYFIASEGGPPPSADIIGALDRETLAVVWHDKVEVWKTDQYNVLNHAPIVDEHRLYLVDSIGTLNVYEKV